MNRSAIDDCSTRHSGTTNRSFLARCQLTVMRANPITLPSTKDLAVTRVGKLRRVLATCLEYRLEISGRTGDDPQNLARRCLLL